LGSVRHASELGEGHNSHAALGFAEEWQEEPGSSKASDSSIIRIPSAGFREELLREGRGLYVLQARKAASLTALLLSVMVEARGKEVMEMVRRILLVLTVALVMAAMMAATAVPAFAKQFGFESPACQTGLLTAEANEAGPPEGQGPFCESIVVV
jgi:hypothetical protein